MKKSKLRNKILEKSFGTWIKSDKTAIAEVKSLRKEWIHRNERNKN